MFHEFRSIQLLEFRKMLHTMCDAFDFVCKKRESLLEFTSSTSKYEIAKHEVYYVPENYYHYQLFDKEVCIIRMLNPKDWLVEDPEQKYFHFALCCIGFIPSNFYGLTFRRYSDHINIGDWICIDDMLKMFHKFCNDLIYDVAGIKVVEQHELELF